MAKIKQAYTTWTKAFLKTEAIFCENASRNIRKALQQLYIEIFYEVEKNEEN